jgi:hypothetical protein
MLGAWVRDGLLCAVWGGEDVAGAFGDWSRIGRGFDCVRFGIVARVAMRLAWGGRSKQRPYGTSLEAVSKDDWWINLQIFGGGAAFRGDGLEEFFAGGHHGGGYA